MDAEQQREMFVAIMEMSKISQNVMGGISTASDPDNGINYQGRRFVGNDAIRLLKNLIAQAELIHEMNLFAILDAKSYLDKLADDLQKEQKSSKP